MSNIIEAITNAGTSVAITNVDRICNDTSTTSSSKIRQLYQMGYGRSAIAKMLTHRNGSPMRYQMVKNVLDRELKRPVVQTTSAFDPDLG